MLENHNIRRFLLVRHGETTANATNVASGGDSDPDLTEAGIQQIYTVADRLKRMGEIPTTIISSKNSRSLHSAEILKECLGADITVDAEFNERSLGVWNDVSLDIVNPMLVAGETPENGESRAEFKERFFRAIDRHLSTLLNNSTIIVGSRGTARILLELANKENAAFFANGRLMRVTIENSDQFKVIDIDYLD